MHRATCSAKPAARFFCRIGAALLLLCLPAEVSAAPPEAADESEIRTRGVQIVWVKSPSLIDVPRARKQRDAGCRQGKVRFGDTAAMRGQLPGLNWSEAQRQRLVGAALSDSFELAQQQYRSVLDGGGLGPSERATVENQSVLTALQFDRVPDAAALLAKYSDLPPNTPSPLRADRLFLGVLIEAGDASPKQWRKTIEPRLELAHRLDPTSFAIRVFRVIAWIKSATSRPVACEAAVRRLSDLVLDTTQDNACPLLLGHVAHFTDRQFRAESLTDDPRGDDIWRIFATGVFASVAGNEPVAERARNLLRANTKLTCAATALDALQSLDKAR